MKARKKYDLSIIRYLFHSMCNLIIREIQQVDKVPHGLILSFCKPVVNKANELSNEFPCMNSGTLRK